MSTIAVVDYHQEEHCSCALVGDLAWSMRRAPLSIKNIDPNGDVMSERDGTILVTGSTGATGSALVQELVARGAPVTAMVRGASAAVPDGVATVVADFDDAAS